MPSSSGIFRAMDWSMVQEVLPNEISTNLPDGDPFDNRESIEESIEQLKNFGPKGKKIIDSYVEGDISDEEMFSELDRVIDEIDDEEFEEYKRNLDRLIDAIEIPVWKQYCPIVSATMNKNKMYEVAEELHNIDLYNDGKLGSTVGQKNAEILQVMN